jgi:hypothetical protein
MNATVELNSLRAPGPKKDIWPSKIPYERLPLSNSATVLELTDSEGDKGEKKQHTLSHLDLMKELMPTLSVGRRTIRFLISFVFSTFIISFRFLDV